MVESSEVQDLTAELKQQCPGGIDKYFETAGWKHLEAVLSKMIAFGCLAGIKIVSSKKP